MEFARDPRGRFLRVKVSL